MNIFEVLWAAPLTVKLILVVLVCFSVVSFAVFTRKRFAASMCESEVEDSQVRILERGSVSFEEIKATYKDLNAIELSIPERIIWSSFSNAYDIKTFENSFNNEIGKYRNVQSKGMLHLANISNSAPYIGLLGTCFGIMHIFWSMGGSSQVSLASIAPGMAEALIATAIGLFVAIPSNMFFNFLTDKHRDILENIESLKSDLLLRLKDG